MPSVGRNESIIDQESHELNELEKWILANDEGEAEETFEEVSVRIGKKPHEPSDAEIE